MGCHGSQKSFFICVYIIRCRFVVATGVRYTSRSYLYTVSTMNDGSRGFLRFLCTYLPCSVERLSTGWAVRG